ncbi:hypothetical protein CQW23_08608 [Capsicum baccatum]|uniref:Disease resistance protein winged helix domain-containing protein n=1 Tax=Capsicum baccatum TaxID=33114 RepID=A0A2G2X9G4_CAPBA|nr:hypothetical protein CQW23_08608 [Capsicum baccatum]
MISAMERLAKDMVNKCGGLPLTIVVLRGLLSYKRKLEEWKKVAEGFIPRGEERIEDVVEGVLNELIRQSLVQVANIVWEKVVEYRIHDLLRHVVHGQAQRYLSPDLSNLKLRRENRETASVRPISKFYHNDGPSEFKTHGRSDAYSGEVAKPKESRISRAYRGKQITCSDNSFGQLEFLHLNDLHNLERWDLATSAMPLIKGLGIHDCPKLNKIPKRVKEVERLKRTHL